MVGSQQRSCARAQGKPGYPYTSEESLTTPDNTIAKSLVETITASALQGFLPTGDGTIIDELTKPRTQPSSTS